MTTKKSAQLTRRAALAAAGAGAATALAALLTPAQAYYNRPTVRYRPAFRYTYHHNARYGRRNRVIIVDNGGN